jgi:hypothetical protein
MTSGSSDEQLIRLLADTLSPVEQGLLARHVNGCASCQHKLADWTGTTESETWRRAGPPAPISEAEEGMVQEKGDIQAFLRKTCMSPPVGVAQPEAL